MENLAFRPVFRRMKSIALIDQEVVLLGSHDELYAVDGTYRRLISME